MSDVTIYTAAQKREIANSFDYWHYEFDLGDGVKTCPLTRQPPAIT